MECYLDNAATTRPFSEVCDLVTRVMYEDFGNPSSLHMKGVIAERYVRQAREQIAKTLKCAAKNIVFTSGGTESNNMALIGSALANARAGKHIITTCFEHAAVYEPLLYLEKMGYEVTYLPVDSMGHVSEETLENALRKDTILVSTMLVNNEVGAILDVEKFSKIVKAFNKDIIFHVDAIQAYGKMNIYPKRMGIDLLSVSGHKIHGPKGTGFLYVGDKVKIHPYIHGGGQQQGMRSGTENVPGIAGLSLAAEKMYADQRIEQKEIGVDTARYIMEIDDRWKEFHTGADGCWGNTFTYFHTRNGRKQVDGKMIMFTMPEEVSFEEMKRIMDTLFAGLQPVRSCEKQKSVRKQHQQER